MLILYIAMYIIPNKIFSNVLLNRIIRKYNYFLVAIESRTIISHSSDKNSGDS